MGGRATGDQETLLIFIFTFIIIVIIIKNICRKKWSYMVVVPIWTRGGVLW
jgi:hypothetical protein